MLCAMNKTIRKDALQFLPMKTILAFSLIISVAFHLVFALAFYFGESLFSPDKMPESRHAQHETLEMLANQPENQAHFDNDFEPRPPHNNPESRKPIRFDRALMFTSFSFVLIFVLFLFNRKMMSINYKRKWSELLSMIFGSILITSILSIVFSLGPSLFEHHRPNSAFLFRIVRDGLMRDFSLMTIVILISHLLRSLFNQRTIAVENEALRAENISTRYEALKSQMDPHFLFNSLNTLQSLIETDKDKAENYIQQLSFVLRYTLQNKEIITLSEELKCVRSYCNMMQIRYGENLKFDFHVDAKYHDSNVLPLSIQGLIENAIKHNVISARQPLTVTIATGNCTIKVSNPIQPKIMDETGNGIGLSNLAERYRLMWNEEVKISNDGNVFEVILPLEGSGKC